MKSKEAKSNTAKVVAKRHSGTFSKVLNGRKQPIRGLWVRNGRYYAQLTFDEPTGEKKTRRVPLLDKSGNPADSVAKATEAMERLRMGRSDNDLPVLTRTPKFADYVPKYLEYLRAGAGVKAESSIDKAESALNGWITKIGGVHLDKIRPIHVNTYRQERLEAGLSRRTVNLDVIALNGVLKKAREDGYIKTLPTEAITALPVPENEKRPLFTNEDLGRLCDAALAKNPDGTPVTKNGQEFADYLRLMAYSGTRRNEALGLKWSDVNFDLEQLHVSRQVKGKGLAPLKGKEVRQVQFSDALRAHLLAMKERRAPDTEWLFPSPQRGAKDIPAHSFRESLELARTHAAKDHPHLANKGFHDCRHHFISYAVMCGTDFMTIASWVGHKDGGVLIGKVYGHLADDHKRAAASRLNFGPVALKAINE